MANVWLGEPPSLQNIVFTLQECRKNKDLAYGKCMHMHLCNYGLEAHTSFGNHLVPMFLECGGFQDAKKAFNKLVYPNEHSWTSLIQGYIVHGELQFALHLFQKMQEDCVHPTEYTFVPLLKACARLKCVVRGKELHAEIIQRGFDNDAVLGNTLVDMYAKFCMIVEAHETFDQLPVQDLISWNILISGYAEQGLSEEAHTCYKQMLLEGLLPDSFTFVYILKACGNTGSAEGGQEIHAEVIKEGYEDCAFVGSTLVDMYAQCGLPEEAQDVFDQLPMHDVVLWTALIACYAEHGLAEEALSCFQKMQLEGMYPDGITLVCSLKACGTLGAIDRGQELHSQIVKQEMESDPFLGNTLVYMYARCGLLADSREVFDKLQDRDVVSWTALISGYADCGLGREALDSFERMQVEGISPNAATFICILRACCCIGAIGRGGEIHAEVAKKGFERDVFVCNALVDFYRYFSFLGEARGVFNTFPIHDVSSWNVLIAVYAEHGLGEKVSACLERMQVEGVSPDAATYVCCLTTCVSARVIEMGRKFHAEVLKKGFERKLIVGSALVDLYANCGSLTELQDVFGKLPLRDVILWNIFISGYVEYGLYEEASSCLEQMQLEGILPDVVSWNVVILGFVEQGEGTKSLELYSQMQAQGLSPDNVMFVSILKACGNITALEIGKRVHAQIYRVSGFEGVELANALVDMYGRCGSMSHAQEVFNAKPSKILVRWNALIAGYARQGTSELVFHYFHRMTEEGIHPDEFTFLSVLTACSHAGSLSRGHKYFEAMSNECGISPTIKHCTCMVDLLGRAGQLDEAIAMVKKMPSQPDLVVWDMVLGACQKWGNAELGRQAFDYVVGLDENHSAAYILLSNIYVDPHLWNDAKNDAKITQCLIEPIESQGAGSPLADLG